MKINKVNVYKITLPFKIDVTHSRRKGASVKNVIVEVVAEEGGVRGYGEGAPRQYVTGESQEKVVKTIEVLIRTGAFPWEISRVDQIRDFVDSLPYGKECNSAICALEISLLDLLGKKEGKSILEYFPHDFFKDTICYGGGVALASKERMIDICRVFKDMNINKMKLKMGRDFNQNREAFNAVSLVFGDDYDLRVDVNGAWDHELAFQHVPMLREYNVKVVEQPMDPDDSSLGAFAGVMKNDGIYLMADESICTLEDLQKLEKEGHYEMFNIRLSKCGGFRRSFEMIDYLREKELSFQVASQLGESGVLSAAGRAFSLLCGDATYYEGSYDEFLLSENITLEQVSFGDGGNAGPLNGTGLGVNVSREKLNRLSSDSPKKTITRAKVT